MITFESTGLKPELLQAIDELGFDQPMPIQEKVIPVLLKGDTDLIGLAQTGTGKTAAFGLPLLNLTDLSLQKTQALILCPTRELCLQIAKDLKSYSTHLEGVRIVSIYGGADINGQIRELKHGAHFIVATPGRMKDVLERGKADISNVRWTVLDEADEMLNMGFQEELNAILDQTPKSKNMLLFSATMSKEVASIASGYMKDPIEIVVGQKNTGSVNVEHDCYMVNAHDRYLALKRIIDVNPDLYGLVFCRTRMETKEVAEKLLNDGYNADALHGDLSQAQRDMVMQKFRNKNLQVLVATDVAARGLDVTDLTHVINYNLPDDIEIYTHRSGRTGRAGKEGVSVVIIHSKEQYKIHQIEKVINRKFNWKKVPGGAEICEKQLFSLINKVEEVDCTQIEPFLPRIYEKLESLSREEIIKRLFSLEFNRIFDYYKNAPDLNKVAVSKKSEKNSGKTTFNRFFISIGTKDEVTTRDLIGLINDAVEDRDIEIGKIDLMKSFSFFEADSNYTDKILNSFQHVEVSGRKIVVEQAQERKPSASSRSKKEKFREGRFSEYGKNSHRDRERKGSKDRKYKKSRW